MGTVRTDDSKTLTIILAGGAGSRLGALTEHRAKPVMPFAGTYHLIDFALSNCMHSGLSDVWVVEQYQPHSLNEHLANGRPWDLDRTYGGLVVLPPFSGAEGEGFAEGNADALYRHKAFIERFAPDIVLVLSADHVYKLDYRAVIARHRERDAEVTMVVTEVEEDAGRFGVVQADGDDRVTDFAYKPDEPRGNLVTTEVFAYDTRALLEVLDELAAEGENGEEGREDNIASLKDFGDRLLPRLVERGRAHAYRFDGYWRDVGTLPAYWQAHQDLLAPEPALRLDDEGWPILTYGVQRPPARIHARARIDNSLVSPGCVVRGEVVRSVLAPGVVVEEGAVVRDSILLHEAVIQAGARVERAIVDEGACVAEGARGAGAGEITVIASA
uniref:Glucose-1-phosphate adenylyltransferase n=1 Tax=uncultured Armatimonadetes bacterium TaxID=157466 RepID=A0A6J4J992_9BACT|nr:Glucose-1-phosphate adenylyltransferase [uncultured Armatimonadetes bacterium]